MLAPEDTTPITIANARVVASERVLWPGWMTVANGRVAQMGEGDSPASVDLDARGAWLAPGFVDMHVHGGGGAAFTIADEIASAVSFHRAHGTTTLLASLVTAPIAVLERQLLALRAAISAGDVRGVHLEGPWLSKKRAGAHDLHFLAAPDRDDVQRLLDTGVVRMVTVAPELPGAVAAMRQVVDAGAVAAIGHTDATYAQTRDGLAAGATVATHLLNAMRPLHHREPGPSLALLEAPGVTVELIADGLHVHPSVLRFVVHSVGTTRAALVTDAIAAAGQPDGDYLLGSVPVRVQNGTARVRDSDALAGSTLTMADAVRNAVQYAGLPIEDAIRMATDVPARAIGLADSAGSIRPGADADLVLLDEAANLLAVMRRGNWIKLWSDAAD